MEPIKNEPKGWGENEERHQSELNIHTDVNENERPIDVNDNDLAGVAQGNLPDSEDKRQVPQSDDPRGFMGDFAEPQHDD